MFGEPTVGKNGRELVKAVDDGEIAKAVVVG